MLLSGNANFGPHMAAGPAVRPSGHEATAVPRAGRPGVGALFLSIVLVVMAFGPLAGQGLDQEVRYSARDSIRYDLSLQTVYLFGGATVKYGDITLTADRLAYDLKNEEVRAFGAPDSSGIVVGKPVFTEGSHTIESDSIRYNFTTKKALIRNVRTEEQQAYVHANVSKRQPNEEVHSKGGMLTTCDRPRPHYHFKVSRMIVIPDDKIVAGPAYMKVGNVPTPLAIPFGLFPNKPRGASGILIPTWGESEQLGFFLLNGGYYMPLSDQVDLQLTGDIYSRGSWGARAFTRYKQRYRYNGSLDLSYNNLLNSDPDFPDFSEQRTFFVRWNHLLDPRASLTDRFSASVNVGSSQYFTNNFNSSTYDYLSNTFQSNIQWSHQFGGRIPSSLAINARHAQNTLNRTFDLTLPSITYNVQRFFPGEMLRGPRVGRQKWYERIGVNYSANFDNRLSTTEDQLSFDNLPNLLADFRNGIRHTAQVNTSFKTKAFTINPDFRATDRWYFETLRKTYVPDLDSTITDTVPGFRRAGDWSVGANLTSKLYGTFVFGGGKLKAIRHVITPQAGVSYRPDFGTQVEGPFGTDGATSSYSPFDIGIYGKPPQGESGLLTLGLIQSLEAKVRDGKASTPNKEVVRKLKLIDFFGINTSYDWLRDSLNWNPLNIAARTSFMDRIHVNLTSLWDPYATNELGQRIQASTLDVNGQLLRLTNLNTAVGFDLKSPRYGQPVQQSSGQDEQVVGEADPDKGAKVNFSLPWRLNVNYSYDLARFWAAEEVTDTERQSVLFNGDVNILQHWKLGFSSGYDLVAEEWTPTSLNLYWDLHCWEFNFNIIPIGVRKSFSFRINVKASILRDLKYEQRRPYGNNNNLLF